MKIIHADSAVSSNAKNIRLIFSYRGAILRTCLSLLKNRLTFSRHFLWIVVNRLGTSFSSRNQASSFALYSLNRLSAFLSCFHGVLMSTKARGIDEQQIVESKWAASRVIELPKHRLNFQPDDIGDE